MNQLPSEVSVAATVDGAAPDAPARDLAEPSPSSTGDAEPLADAVDEAVVAPADEAPVDETVVGVERELSYLVKRALRSVPKATDNESDRSRYPLVAHLGAHGPMRMSDLAEYFALDKSTISRQVHHLEADGLIERTVDHEDRRAYLLALTERGREALRTWRRARHRFLGDMLRDWPEQDRREFARLLARFNESMEQCQVAAGQPQPVDGLPTPPPAG
ncbi:MarR family winged helix-turn-helix transcriptional regulator [Allostreptomyces psammosilenae]|uniref:DNA-binding MarR family transcriptional regulator n=1 Tax=Allostreptomyces psammosilenae TaxID=1892865 RepID=A0A852ZUD0_9ACTN|nr:MarR family transcriptional regulator [Allostreptomyces psammosilenae]NYI05505.1 DNA-binding MarR family transcriptional regulator [Allostreptomyces psammosilenae]